MWGYGDHRTTTDLRKNRLFLDVFYIYLPMNCLSFKMPKDLFLTPDTKISTQANPLKPGEMFEVQAREIRFQ